MTGTLTESYEHQGMKDEKSDCETMRLRKEKVLGLCDYETVRKWF